MSKEKANILVTGCAGFIGSHMVDLLIDNGHNVEELIASHMQGSRQISSMYIIHSIFGCGIKTSVIQDLLLTCAK